MKIHKTIKYDPDLLVDYNKISKVSGVPRDKLVEIAMRSQISKYKQQYPDWRYAVVGANGRLK